MYDVSATFGTEQAKSESSFPVEMAVVNASQSGFDPLYYVNLNQDCYGFELNATGDLTTTATLYTGLPLKIGNIESNAEGRVADLTISIPNTDRVIESIIQNRNYLRGNDVHIISTFAENLPSGVEYNLIGYWPFDESSGTNAPDKSRNSNNGTFEGTTPAWTTGIANNCASFAGVNERIDCGNSAPLDDLGNNSDFSISFWMKSVNTTPNGYEVLFTKYQGVDDYIWISAANNSNVLSIWVRSGATFKGTDNFTDITPWDKTWHHIAMVFSFTNGKVYAYDNAVKSTVEATLDVGDWSNTGNVCCGALNTGNSPYEGLLDECRIYNKALNQAEVTALYEYPSGNVPVDIFNTANHIGTTEDKNAAIKEVMYVDSTTSTTEAVVFSCKPKFIIKNMILPRRKYFVECQWDYNSSECAVSSTTFASYPTCNYTLSDCRIRKNTSRYGGFPSLPMGPVIII